MMRSVLRRWPGIGIVLTGLAWGLGTWSVRADDIAALQISPSAALVWIMLGALAQTIATWVGFSAVLWAMARAFGTPSSLARLLTLSSASAAPLWLAAPAVAVWLHGPQSFAAIAAVTVCAAVTTFLVLFVKVLAEDTGWPHRQAGMVLGAATVFLASFAFLST